CGGGVVDGVRIAGESAPRDPIAAEARTGVRTQPELPNVFHAYFGNLEEQPHADRSEDLFDGCFGCGAGHPDGLYVRCFKTAEGVASPIIIPLKYEGPRGAAQGGIVATYMDEVLGAAVARSRGVAAVTGEITVRYVKPVPIEAPLIGHGLVTQDHGRYVDVEGRLEELATGRLVASARGRFFPIES